MTGQPCPCGQPIPDHGTLCHRCTGRLRRDLLDIPTLISELTFTALRQSKTGDPTTRSGGTPMPWNERARQAQDGIRTAVLRWAAVLTSERLGEGTTIAAFARNVAWLADQTNLIRLRPWAPAMAADIRQAVAAGWRAIDRPENRWYAGPCGAENRTPDGALIECGWTLWARIDQLTITCPQCRTPWRVDERREWLLSAADDVHETAPAIASALTIMLRVRVSPATIRWWASNGDLAPVGERGTAKLYRVGDVLTLINRRNLPTDTPQPEQKLTSA